MLYYSLTLSIILFTLPNGNPNTAKEQAVETSFEPNHVIASFEGILRIKTCPEAQSICPIIARYILSDSVQNIFNVTPSKVSNMLAIVAIRRFYKRNRNQF